MKFGSFRGVRNGDKLGLVLFDLRDEFVEIGACGKGGDSETAGESLNNGEALAADGAGGTEDGDVFQDFC